MQHRYRTLDEQTLVITGATSGIGLATARLAASEGAQVVLAARNGAALRQLCSDIRKDGGRAVYAVADVGDEEQVKTIVDVAVREFGGFDTWVNNAGTLVFSELDALPTEDHEQLFRTNYWGTVFGSQAAVAHLRERQDGGTLINIASINADMPVSILGAYSASKAAVKAYSEVLRMELIDQEAPVKVSIVKPSGIATPIAEHARCHMQDRGKVMPPLYDPQVVARTILAAAQQPVRNITVGGSGRFSTAAWKLAPALADRFIAWTMPKLQSSGKPRLPDDNLYSAGDDGDAYRDGHRQGMALSPYTRARLHPKTTTAVAGVLLGAAALAFVSLGRGKSLLRR